MKSLRPWLLLLLAVLLPLRAAAGAAMLCAPASSGLQMEVQLASDGHAGMHQFAEIAGTHHDHAGHAHHGDSHGDESSLDPSADCNLCSSYCSVTTLLMEPPKAALPAPAATRSFPAVYAPAPSFVSDGQERPPRSI